jgi:hypothetical protein
MVGRYLFATRQSSLNISGVAVRVLG